MARIAAQGQLTHPAPRRRGRRRADGARFQLATPADDPEVRRLLRENPMPGRIGISLEREPDASLAAAVEGDVHHTIVARDPSTGRLIAMGSVSVRDRYVNGAPARVGYLGQLRLDHRCRPGPAIVLGGYRFLRELHDGLGVALYLTSIASDNTAARRLLERGLPGMPTYRPLCELVTVVFRRRRNGEFWKAGADARAALRRDGFSLRHGTAELMPAVADLLNASGARFHFAPVWSGAALEGLADCGLRHAQFRIAFAGDGRPAGCAAVWDQRGMKQVVVRRYPEAYRACRVALNLLAPLTRLPRLPALGQPCAHAFVSHVATPPDRPQLIGPLIEALHGSANTLGADCLSIGLEHRDPRLAVVRRRFGGTEYRTCLYAVHWPDDAAGRAAADALDGRPCQPEVALL